MAIDPFAGHADYTGRYEQMIPYGYPTNSGLIRRDAQRRVRCFYPTPDPSPNSGRGANTVG